MKTNSVILLLMITLVCACTRQGRDTSIKADLATKAKAELDFAGVRFTVIDGSVTLNGVCPTQKTKDKVLHTVNKLYGVKGVTDNIQIGDVVIGTDLLLKQDVDKILMNYPRAEAITRDSVVTVMGSVEQDKIIELTELLKNLHPKKLQEQLSSY